MKFNLPEIKKDLIKKQKQLNCLTVSKKINSLEFIYYSKTNDFRVMSLRGDLSNKLKMNKIINI